MATDSTVTTPRRAGRLPRALRSRFFGWLVFAGVLLAWQRYASTHPSPRYATVTDVAAKWWSEILGGPLPAAILQTLRTMLIGYAIAAVLAVAVGVLMARVRFVYVLVEPPLELLRPMPISAVIPLLILYLGIDDAMKISVVALAAFFHILLNAYSGAGSTPRTMMDTARTFGLTWRQTMAEVVIPAAAPAIFVGLRSALAASLVISVVVGMIAGNDGLGHLLMIQQQSFLVTDLIVGAATIAMLGYLLNFAFLFVERRILHWHFGATRAQD
ncbi:ABC transporter permease [Microbispora triticiradicis]|uniref:ABC transporter permease n=4 Tax=Microbispora TaxID=2005 RepID=A0ABY3LWD1_9ACTN|nr:MULTISPECIES: ABC transporter permease [Microbispora]GLW25392.1 sulfonate ABC transporter [Microbispora amethystogenes]KAA9376066.1 ABC transporter permease [Microbispora cellulosiformans]RGA05658.1 ABC transporter permease [Microbispora triticiradicis]TLP57943.1 ABC transporter permease [Microbispora fusca]TYB56246.1 ABC transporter permease [Microbispora tritici]